MDVQGLQVVADGAREPYKTFSKMNLPKNYIQGLRSPWIKRNNYSQRQGEKQTGKGRVCGTCRTTKTKPNRGGN